MKKLVIFLSCVVGCACSDNKNISIPSTVLSEQKMAGVMTDIHLLEATLGSNFMRFPINRRFSKNKYITVSSNETQTEDILLALLKKNGVSPEVYKRSYIFYTANPELLNEVYKLIINNLSELQAKIAAEKDPSPKDSTRIRKP